MIALKYDRAQMGRKPLPAPARKTTTGAIPKNCLAAPACFPTYPVWLAHVHPFGRQAPARAVGQAHRANPDQQVQHLDHPVVRAR